MTPPIHVLYIDDNVFDQELVRDALNNDEVSFRLSEASTREVFEDLLAKEKFDLVLTDFNINGFEGLEVLEIVKSRPEALPVIVITGTGSEEIAVTALQNGAADYIIKTPRHIQRLPQAIQVVLARQKLEQDLSHQDLEREKLEHQLRQAQKMEAVGRLAGGIAHDFNNILQGMFGFIEFAQNGLDPADKRFRYIEEVRKGAERAATLIKQLLAFSRHQVMDLKNLDIGQLVDDLLKIIRRTIGENIELVFTNNAVGAVASIDQGQFEQVLMNLCINARDAMPQGGKLDISTSLVQIDEEYIATHSWADPGRYLQLSVRDNGEGIDAAIIARVFDPFYTTKEVGKGSGLGLATVYGIVKQHNGIIDIDSKPGEGTTVDIYLPFQDLEAVAPGAEPEGLVTDGSETILVAEDEDMVLRMVQHVLSKAGYEVLTAVDGEEACTLFQERAADISLALLDVVMPKMSGQKVSEKIKELKPEVKVLFTSGYTVDEIHSDFILEEGLDLIQKPYAPNSLLRKIREILDRE